MNKAALLPVIFLLLLQGCAKNITYLPVHLNDIRKIADNQIKLLPKETEITGSFFYVGTSYPFYALYKKINNGYDILFFDPYMRQTGQIIYNGSDINYKFVQKGAGGYIKLLKPILKQFASLLFGKINLRNLKIKQERNNIIFSKNGFNFTMKTDKLVLAQVKSSDILIKYGDYTNSYKGIWIAEKLKIFNEGMMIAEFSLRNMK